MKRIVWIGILFLLALTACDATTREARRMVKRAERLADTLPDSTVRLIDSVLRMPASFSERERMDMAMLQAEALFGERGQEISPVMDDDFFDEHAYISTSPELERAAVYYAKKKQYAKAAHAALYSGFVQQHYDEKEAAMRSFKEAEQYGEIAGDSLTLALSKYWIGKMLYYEARRKEALSYIKSSECYIGNHDAESALMENSKAVIYILMSQNDSAYICLENARAFANKAHFNATNKKVLNNYAVLCRLEGKYKNAIAHLRQMASSFEMDETEVFVYYLNMGKTFNSDKEMDSAAFYFKRVETLLPHKEIKLESRVSAYDALSQFAEQQEDIRKALQYKNQREELLATYLSQRQEQVVYRIQKLYDYESLQNSMNRKIVYRQRIIMFLSISVALVLIAFAISQIRLARIRKQEADLKASLLDFIQRNNELVLRSERQEKEREILVQKQKNKESACHELEQQNEEYKHAYEDCAARLSEAQLKEQRIMQKLTVYLGNDKDAALLGSLRQTVLGNCDYWEAMTKAFDKQFPGMRKELMLQHPDLSDKEIKILILSYIDTSREDTALLLNISIHMVDKLRNMARKKLSKNSH